MSPGYGEPPLVDRCVKCGESPRALGGRLSRCWGCVKTDATRDREARERRGEGASNEPR